MMRINLNSMTRILLSAVFLMRLADFTSAQTTPKPDFPKLEIFAGYSALGEVNKSDINFGAFSTGSDYPSVAGIETSVTRNLSRHFGLKGDFSAHFNTETDRATIVAGCPTPPCSPVTQDFTVKTRVFNFLGGPEFKARNSSRFTPIGYTLAGVAHTTARFTSGPTFNILANTGHTGFAMALGGGVDIRAGRKVSFRATMDYNPLFNSGSNGGTRHFVRISTGVLFGR